MENNTSNTNGKTGFFSILYRTRLVVMKGDTTILNLSLLFGIISLLCAPWLVVIGAIIALVLGYRFSIDRNAAAFDKDFEHVVKDAAQNVKSAVENVTGANHDGGSDDSSNGAQM
jgi:uncharacterized membrane protein